MKLGQKKLEITAKRWHSTVTIETGSREAVIALMELCLARRDLKFCEAVSVEKIARAKADDRIFCEEVELDGRGKYSLDWFPVVPGTLKLTFPHTDCRLYHSSGNTLSTARGEHAGTINCRTGEVRLRRAYRGQHATATYCFSY